MNINDRTGWSKNTAFPETWKNGDLTAYLSVYIYISYHHIPLYPIISYSRYVCFSSSFSLGFVLFRTLGDGLAKDMKTSPLICDVDVMSVR